MGLHVRRTDYVQFSKQVLGKRVASKAYFQEARDLSKRSELLACTATCGLDADAGDGRSRDLQLRKSSLREC